MATTNWTNTKREPSAHNLKPDSNSSSRLIALDSLGQPHLVYKDDTDNALIYVYYDKEAGAWSDPDTVDATAGTLYGLVILVDSSDAPHIFYSNGANVLHRYQSGGVWTEESISASTQTLDAAIDVDDNFHICYQYMHGALYYRKGTTGSWAGAVTLDAGHSNFFAVCSCKIAVDSEGNPAVVFGRRVNPDNATPIGVYFIASTNGGTSFGASVEVQELAITASIFPSICYDSLDDVHITYRVGTVVTEITHAKSVDGGANWTTEIVGIDADVDNTSGRCPIQIDPHGYAHVAYSANNAPQNHLKYSRWTGSAWQVTTIQEPTVGAEETRYHDCSAFRLDTEGYAHVVFTTAEGAAGPFHVWYGTAQVYDLPDIEPPLPPTPESGSATTGYTEVRLYAKAGGRKVFPNYLITDYGWELIERGFFGQATVTIVDTFDGGVSNPVGEDRIEIWRDGILRYRGYVSMVEQVLGEPEQKIITAYGLANRMTSIIAWKRYIYPGGTDISQAFTDIVSDLIAPQLQNLERDIQFVNYNVENFDCYGMTIKEVFDNLCDQAARQAVWGFDIAPSGNNRIFIRPKEDGVKYKYQAGGNIKSWSYPPDYGNIVNRVRLIGAESKFPNLIENASFEYPKQADNTDGNLMNNGGFELGTAGWTLQGSGNWIKTDNPHSGTNRLNLNDDGERARSPYCDVTAENTYMAEVFFKPTNADPDAGSMWYLEVHYYNNVNVELSSERFPAAGESYTEIQSTYWHMKRITFTTPVDCVKIKIWAVRTNGNTDGFTLDDFAVWDMDGIVQTGWATVVTGDAVLATDWVYDSDPRVAGQYNYHGAYCVRMTATMTTGTAYLTQTAPKAIQIDAGMEYQYLAKVKNLGASAIDVKQLLRVKKTNNVERDELSAAKECLPGVWTSLVWDTPTAGFTMESDDASVRVGLLLEETADILIDCLYFGKLDTEGGNGGTGYSYIPEQNIEYTLDTTMPFVQDAPSSIVSDEVKASVATYGYRDAEESVPAITDLEPALRWLWGYFGIHAVPVIAHRVELFDVEADIKPDGLFDLLGASFDPGFPTRISFKVDNNGTLSISLDLNLERPSFEGLLRRIEYQSAQTTRLTG